MSPNLNTNNEIQRYIENPDNPDVGPASLQSFVSSVMAKLFNAENTAFKKLYYLVDFLFAEPGHPLYIKLEQQRRSQSGSTPSPVNFFASKKGGPDGVSPDQSGTEHAQLKATI